MLTSLVSLQQGNDKKSEKKKKQQNSLDWRGKSSYPMKDLSNFTEIFRKCEGNDNINSH